MKVFISWSGERARAVAEALRDWLPDIIQSVEPWVSSEDIGAGERWSTQIAKELSETRFGIICVTPENQQAPWLLFETGALAKTIENTNVCPYLIGLEKSDLKPGPLTQFQAMDANEAETWKLIQTMNRSSGDERLEETRLQRIFERSWPILEESLSRLPEPSQNVEPKRDVEAMTEEILELVRVIARRKMNVMLERPVFSPDYWTSLQLEAATEFGKLLETPTVDFDEKGRSIFLLYSDNQREEFVRIKDKGAQLLKLVQKHFGKGTTVRITGPGDEFFGNTSFTA